MPATNDTLDRLEVRFIAEPSSSNRPTLPGGWWIWCLLGVVIGIATWELGASFLNGSLKARLTPDQPAADAILAVEGLELLGEDSVLDIVDALKHPDERVARAAFNALNRQLTNWQTLELPESQQQMQALVSRLNEMPGKTPSGGLILASGLASRVFTFCLEQDSAELRPLIRMCETVIKNTGIAANNAAEKIQSPTSQTNQTQLATQVDVLQQELRSLPSNPEFPTDAGEAAEGSAPQPPLNRADGTIAFTDNPAGVPSPRLNQAGNGTTTPQRNLTSSGNNSPEMASIRLTDMRGSVRGQQSPYSTELPDLPTASPSTNPALSINPAPSSNTAGQFASYPGSQPQTVGIQIGDGSNVALEEQRAPRIVETSQVVTSRSARVGNAANMDADSMVQLEFQELVSLLASHDPSIAQNAAYALKVKGLSDDRIILASRLATSSTAERLSLIQNVANDGNLDPRPWLLWMAREGETEVRTMAVSLLANMIDQDVARELRMLLNRERDSSVQQVIRQSLMSLR